MTQTSGLRTGSIVEVSNVAARASIAASISGGKISPHAMEGDELAEAAAYVRSLLPAPLARKVETEWCFQPSEHLGGDTFGPHFIDDEHLAVYLLDVCGHGVGAALLSVSVLNALRSENLPGVDFRRPERVLAGLNRVFRMERQNNLFFSIWYGVYQVPRRELRFASGGHPPHSYSCPAQTRGMCRIFCAPEPPPSAVWTTCLTNSQPLPSQPARVCWCSATACLKSFKARGASAPGAGICRRI